jgi:hypothetical protein
VKETQYARILDFLRKHRVATVRQLLMFTNYPSSRLAEMTDARGVVHIGNGERITRTWVQRNGVKVRLYCLTKA